ncbi:hypothetical protein A3K63_01025 [Candidatus Micrarchaeota archaeon RBG_16_49_10]|nr:MAG: hypothetical protein A3K63_01025 [Candidatus Micrarchaeota archaeon RBG_16_49_10]
MRSSLGKGQFYLLTAVVIVGFFFLMSKYINPYSFIDSSQAVIDDEIFFFNNLRNQAERVVKLSNDTTLAPNLESFSDIADEVAQEKHYIFSMNYTVRPSDVDFVMALVSEKYSLDSSFTVVKP